MNGARTGLGLFFGSVLSVACGSASVDDGQAASDALSGSTETRIKHVVVIVQENHSFDAYFGKYCKAPTNSKPACHDGPDCYEAAPGHIISQHGLAIFPEPLISHVQMEHSSILKFLEWNFLGKQTGQLGGRDGPVKNIGSLLDPALGVPDSEN